jgi:hypothetical protein
MGTIRNGAHKAAKMKNCLGTKGTNAGLASILKVFTWMNQLLLFGIEKVITSEKIDSL